jgi:general secretion pathway protein A
MYREFFGLSGKPFRLTPDVSFFFPSTEHRRALSFLQYGLEQGDGFIVITGDVGTGKTTLVQALLEELDPKQIRVATVVTTQLGEDDLLRMVAENFGVRLNGETKAAVLRELQKLFEQQVRQGRRLLLIVDEAQNLSPEAIEELRMLSNFHIDGQAPIQMFLVGQEEFRATLLSPGFEQLRQRVIATYHLNPLNLEETRTYIEHRLSLVGWKHDPAFTDEAFDAVFLACEGVPRRINNLCDRLLLFACLEELHRIDAVHVTRVAEEIGAEFMAGLPSEEKRAAKAAAKVFNTPGEPLESVARAVFDKASLQQRLVMLERAVESLDQSVKPGMAEMREELGYIRLLLEDVLFELRNDEGGAKTKRRVQ